MNNIIATTLAAALLTVATFATAQANNSLSAKVQADHPGTSVGSTVNPTARPDNGIGQQIRIRSASSGRTVAPLAKVDTGSLHEQIRTN